MLVLAFSEHITVVLTYIGAFSLVAFPLPGNLFFMIFRWFRNMLSLTVISCSEKSARE